MSKTYRSILKPSSRRRVTSKTLIDRVEKSVGKRLSAFKPMINKELKSRSKTVKNLFKNRHNRYVNGFIRSEIRKKLGKDRRRTVKFQNNYVSLNWENPKVLHKNSSNPRTIFLKKMGTKI
jgi:hypothetical protein